MSHVVHQARVGEATWRADAPGGGAASLRLPAGVGSLLALQRQAGNRALSTVIVQRGIDDDLRGSVVPVPPGQRAGVPPHYAIMTVEGERVLVPCRIYEIDQVPRSLDHHAIRSDSRHEFLTGSPWSRLSKDMLTRT